MPISEEQRLDRRNYVGASDVWGILSGRSYDLWLEKTGRVESRVQPNDAMELGNHVEPLLVRWAATQLDDPESGLRVCGGNGFGAAEYRHDELPLVAHPDGLVKDEALRPVAPIEAKLVGVMGRARDYGETDDDGWRVGWGEPGSDQVPDRTVIQVHAQIMAITSQTRCEIGEGYIPAWIVGRGKQMFRVGYKGEIADWIAEAIHDFWRCVERDVPPEGETPSYAVAKLIRKTPGKTVVIPWRPVKRWLELKAKVRKAQAELREVETRIRAAMGDAEIARFRRYRGQARPEYLQRQEVTVKGHWRAESTRRTLKLRTEKTAERS